MDEELRKAYEYIDSLPEKTADDLMIKNSLIDIVESKRWVVINQREKDDFHGLTEGLKALYDFWKAGIDVAELITGGEKTYVESHRVGNRRKKRIR